MATRKPAQPQLVGPETCLSGSAGCGKGWTANRWGLAVCGQCRRPSPAYLESMMTITTASTKVYACGFCATGAHHNCSFATRNDVGKLTKCGCRADFDHAPRCTDCSRRSVPFTTTNGRELPAADIDPETARCLDPEDCRQHQASLREAAAIAYGRALPAAVFKEAGGDHGKNLDEGGGQPAGAVRHSSQRRTTTAPRATTQRRTTMSDTDFRVKAGGGKGTAVLEALRNTKNHGLTRVQIAEQVGCTTGRVGEVLRFTLAEGTPADKKAVQAYVNSIPARKAAEPKQVAKKAATTKTEAKKTTKAVATKKAAAAPAKKTATKKAATKKATSPKA